ncbi:phage tail assembly chaperone family protein, TAC [Acinetobacter colistiniresistens]|uniref:phage tail assembly chaperone family protein, TAC n=1 Tax=Acinetobacter colistiniresistens TaxID=280145 RepID=UPI0012505A4C|nr:phage tail assembly chaperone family protein, TAC [Acinetobacter colistiniresistens]
MNINLKSLKKVTKVAAPVERTVTWAVQITDENLEFIRESTGKADLSLGDVVELSAQVFIKRLSYKDIEATSKAYHWKLDLQNIENSTLEGVDSRLLRAAQLLGSVCENAKGKMLYESTDEVYDSDPVFIEALYQVSDAVNNFSGKSQTKNSEKMNSGVNSSSTESADEQSTKQSET